MVNLSNPEEAKRYGLCNIQSEVIVHKPAMIPQFISIAKSYNSDASILEFAQCLFKMQFSEEEWMQVLEDNMVTFALMDDYFSLFLEAKIARKCKQQKERH